MKKSIISILLIFASINIFAQKTQELSEPNKHQLNIGYFNAFNLTSINNLGIGYKYTFKDKGALRVATSFNYSDDKREYDNRLQNNSSIGVNPRVGYEFHMNFRKIIVFYGVDIVGSYIESKESIEYYDPDLYKYNSESTITYKGIGVSPILGVQYQINNSISISTETSFDFMYKKVIRDDGEGNYGYEQTSFMAKLSPLGIFSVNIHF